jgi:glycosyltransferase involved in cell wall biosynthesis
MHIAHVTPRYLPSQLRGGEQYIRILCEQLAQQEETTVLTSNSIDLEGNAGAIGNYYLKEKSAIINNVKVTRFPVVPLLSYSLRKIERRFRLISKNWIQYPPLDDVHILGWGPFTPAIYPYITSSKFDFVHATIWPTTTLYMSFKACKRAKIPYAVTPFYHYRLSMFNQSSVLRQILPSCTAIIAVTEGERDELIKIGAPPKRTFVVPLALEPSNLSGNRELFRKKYGLQGKVVVLASPWVGKGANDVLLALKQLSRKYSNLAMVTFGEPDPEYLSMLTSAKPLNFKVINLGWIYGQTKEDTFAGADIFAMPSTSDAFGMVYLELWAYGKPVIGARNTALECIIKDGHDGFLVEMHDINELESKLEELAKDSELATRMGQNGKEKVRTKYTPANMAGLFKEALTKSLELGLPY